MAYLFIDESGDLGFGSKGSAYFVMACVKISDETCVKQFKRIPKKVKQKKLKKADVKKQELKFSNSSEGTRKKFLALAAKLPIEIFVLIIKKEYTKQALRDNLPVLYNYLIKILLEKPIWGLGVARELNICLDASMSKTQRDNFEIYIKTEFFNKFKQIPSVRILHASSYSNECLQVTDFICGAFGYKYNAANLGINNEQYTKIIKERIKIEQTDLFNKNANRIYLS